MIPPPFILIADADRGARAVIVDQLRMSELDAAVADDARAMHRILERESVDILVLDLDLPGEDGLSLCRDMRPRSDAPAIILTALAGTLDRAIGLEMGADDFVTKPFEPREMIARIRNLLRRQARFAGQHSAGGRGSKLLFNNFTLDLERRHLVAADGRVIMLSGVEFRVLRALAQSPGRVISREHLARISAGRRVEAPDRAVDLQISRLRAKLGDNARAPELIKTVRNGGYLMAAPVEPKT